MSDFSSFVLNYNTGTDASPTWTGTSLAFGGSGGSNELRFAPSTGATTTTASASWPFVTRPGSGTAAVPQLWAFTSDAVGLQVATYDGSNTASRVLRWSWDSVGTFAAAPQFSAFGDNTHATPSAGTQPGAQSGSPIVNGHATDTSSTSYLKANAYGYGVDTGGTQQTPSSGAAGSTLTVTSGTAGSVSPGTGAWLSTWQSLQGWTQYILDGVVPKATTAGFWYWTCALFTGVNMSTGTLLPTITLQYSYS